jgi:hypothetical protein
MAAALFIERWPSQSSRFLKKAAQKLLLCWSRDLRTPMAQIQRSLFASFSSEKEAFAFTRR